MSVDVAYSFVPTVRKDRTNQLNLLTSGSVARFLRTTTLPRGLPFELTGSGNRICLTSQGMSSSGQVLRVPNAVNTSGRNIVNKLTLRKSAVIAFSAILVSTFALSAEANLVTNGSFETTIGRIGNTTNTANPTAGMLLTSANITGPSVTPITLFGWNTTQDGIGCVTFPNTYVNGVCGPGRFAGSGFQAGGPGLSPDGGNFVLIDGDRDIPVSTTLYQTLNGLIVGQFYDVFFYQAAAQFLDRSGDTTERWDVSLGGNPANITSDGNFIGGVHLLSDLMNTPGGSFHSWDPQTLRFLVTDSNLPAGSQTSQVLGFFSVGFPGGQPPIVLLDGVSVTQVPEPETLALVGIGLLGALLARRQEKKRA
jgi:hypothetical protein